MGTLQDWINDLQHAVDTVDDEAEKVVSKGSLNIKNEARDLISGRAHLPHYPHAITYDLERGEGSVTGIIGPDKDLSQGPLGNILEDGSINNPPIPHLAPALDNEEPRFVTAAEDLGEQLLAER